MLGVARLTGANADYYLADLGEEVAALAPGSGVRCGAWLGRGSAALGLAGPVAPGALSGLLAGHHPRSGRPLLSRRREVVALDLTLSAPKSVSVAFGLGTPEVARRVLDAHDRAVHAAVAHLEQRAWAARRGLEEGRGLVATDGLIGASFTHCLSRSGDPHLHTHVVAANLAHGADGRWSALDTRGPFAHARAGGALHGAHLRAELTEGLGLSWGWSEGRGWELEDVPPVLRAEFSGRSAEIRATAAALGHDSRAARRVAWASTREPKRRLDGGDDLRARWARRAPAELALRHEPTGVGIRLDEHRFAASIASAPPSGVCRRDVVAAWADALGTGGRVPDVEASVEHWAPAAAAGLGVAERRYAPAAVVPAPHLVALLGPRPAGPDLQPLWREAAAAVERYRERWGPDGPAPDAPTRALVGMATRRIADHLEVRRTLEMARRRIEGRPRATREPEGLSLAL